jgi:hypothetical protein
MVSGARLNLKKYERMYQICLFSESHGVRRAIGDKIGDKIDNLQANQAPAFTM